MKKLSLTADVTEQTWTDMQYFSSSIAKLWPNCLEDKGNGESHCLLVIISAKYGKNTFNKGIAEQAWEKVP